jgi:hypothetical protein
MLPPPPAGQPSAASLASTPTSATAAASPSGSTGSADPTPATSSDPTPDQADSYNPSGQGAAYTPPAATSGGSSHNYSSGSHPGFNLGALLASWFQPHPQSEYYPTGADPYGWMALMTGERYPSTTSSGYSSYSSSSSQPDSSSARQTDSATGMEMIVVGLAFPSAVPAARDTEAGPPPAPANPAVEVTFGASGLTASPPRVAVPGTVPRQDGSVSEALPADVGLLQWRGEVALLPVEEAGLQEGAGMTEELPAPTASVARAAVPPAPHRGGLLGGLSSLDLPGLGRAVDQFFAALGEAVGTPGGRGLGPTLAPWVVATLLAGGAAFEIRRNLRRAAAGWGRWAGLPEIVPPVEEAS